MLKLNRFTTHPCILPALERIARRGASLAGGGDGSTVIQHPTDEELIVPDSSSKLPFGKHPEFVVRAREPFNGGPAPQHLRRSFITPVEQFFVRTHAPVPAVDARSFRLVVNGMVREPTSLPLDEVQKRFTAHRITATLQCAGNRRDQLLAIADIPGEVPWGTEAISNATWEGARLRDILDAAGVHDGARHVEFVGLDQCERSGKRFGFGGSVSLEKAVDPDVLIAWAMNGRALTPVHGFPLRTIVPGYIAARSVKWLAQINVRDKPSENHFQAHAYKLFPPHVTLQTADWESGVMLGELSVTSVITTPAPNANIPAGELQIEGYAMSGGGRSIARVEVSTNDGESWTTATLAPEHDCWTWRLWTLRVTLSPGNHRLVCRATDSAANTQPEDPRSIWNFKGYMNNAWHRVEVVVEKSE